MSVGSSSARVVVADADACSASRRTWFAKGKAESENGLSVVFCLEGLINGTSLDHFLYTPRMGAVVIMNTDRLCLSVRPLQAARLGDHPRCL